MSNNHVLYINMYFYSLDYFVQCMFYNSTQEKKKEKWLLIYLSEKKREKDVNGVDDNILPI